MILDPLSYRTFLGMQAHFNKNTPYDGWKYGFKTRVSEEMLKRNRSQLFSYEKIDRDHKTVLDQVRFFYPSFRNGYVKSSMVKAIYTNHKMFMAQVADVKEKFTAMLENFSKQMTKVSDILGLTGDLPNVYLYSQRGGYSEKDICLILLFLAIPELNKVVSQEPFVYDNWKKVIDFHKPFISIYFNEADLESVKILINDVFQNLSR